MKHYWLAASAAVFLGATPASAELKLESIQAVYGRLGSERSSQDFYPEDEVYFRYLISGVHTNADGRATGELGIALNGPDGKEVLNKTFPTGGLVALGGRSLPGYANVRLPANILPGTYTLTVRFTDQLASESARFQRRFTVKPAAFAIVMPRFYYDAEGKVEAPAAGVVGQTLYFRLSLIGFERNRGKIDTVMDLQVLDKSGQEMMPKPLQAPLVVTDPKEVKQATTLNFSGNVVLNRAGTFTLRMTLTDREGKKTTRFETPLRVTEP